MFSDPLAQHVCQWYWAAKELTAIERSGNLMTIKAPVGAPGFTLKVDVVDGVELSPRIAADPSSELIGLKENNQIAGPLSSGEWRRREQAIELCIDLPKGTSILELS